jgi:hypothetical protein
MGYVKNDKMHRACSVQGKNMERIQHLERYYSSVSIVTGLWTGQLEFSSKARLERDAFPLCYHVQTSSTAHPASSTLLSGINWPEHEADHSLLPNSEVKNMWSYNSIPST